MKVKVCGLKYADNITQVMECKPDFVGFIFYEASKRHVSQETLDFLEQNNSNSKKVGVFVNHPIEEVTRLAERCRLDYLQLHGDESAEYCGLLNERGFKLIKAFQIDENFDWLLTRAFEAHCEYFLFDTASKNYGGSGKQFDWHLLKEYTGSTPFFLSGGIGPEDEETLSDLDLSKLYAIDLNSRFESEPGKKRIDVLDSFITKIRS